MRVSRPERRYPSRVAASPGLLGCNRALAPTHSWRLWEIPWPSPHLPPARLWLPPDYVLIGGMDDDEEDEAEREAFRVSMNRALGIWFAPAAGAAIDLRRGVRRWALHISPRGEYPNASISPPPAILEEYECALQSAGGRVWNVVTYVTESKEFGTHYALSAYSPLTKGAHVTASGDGSTPDMESEALAILASFTEDDLASF